MKFDLDRAASLLFRTPEALTALLAHADEPWIRCTEGTGTWSPFDIVGHLIHGERTDWLVRTKTILAQGESRTFEPFDREAQFTASDGKQIEELLVTFAELRFSNLNELKKLGISDEQLGWEGEHPDFGTVTLRQLLSTWVVHDLGHIAQIARVMAKQYRGEVGPWSAYIPILSVEAGRGS